MSRPSAPQIVTIGEGMIEIAGGIGAGGRIGYGGDVLNVTVALARLGHAPMMLSALGCDPWSDALIAAWAAEGVDTRLIARHPHRVAGLYGISVDAAGERSFTYWRSESAARDLFALPEADALLREAGQADLLVLSGITLSLYDDRGRDRLVALAASVRARGGQVAFDGNYRARGWPDPTAARTAFEAIAPFVSIALPTYEDEHAIHGPETPQAVAARWRAVGAAEVAVKLGVDGAYLSCADGGGHIPTTPQMPVDTSGAGDAFNAGYLAARLRGQAPRDAVVLGHRLAGVAIAHPGAIPPRDAVVDLIS